MGKRKKENDTFLKKTEEEKQNRKWYLSMQKGQFFQCSWNYKEDRLKKNIKKENFKKGVINLTETNLQINMTSDNFISSNNLFKSHLNAKGFNMSLTQQQLLEACWFCFSLCCKSDVNVLRWCEFRFTRKLKASF